MTSFGRSCTFSTQICTPQSAAIGAQQASDARHFIWTHTLGPEMVAAQFIALKPMADGKVEHLIGIGISAEANGRYGELRHTLPPFSGLLSPPLVDCQLETGWHQRPRSTHTSRFDSTREL